MMLPSNSRRAHNRATWHNVLPVPDFQVIHGINCINFSDYLAFQQELSDLTSLFPNLKIMPQIFIFCTCLLYLEPITIIYIFCILYSCPILNFHSLVRCCWVHLNCQFNYLPTQYILITLLFLLLLLCMPISMVLRYQHCPYNYGMFEEHSYRQLSLVQPFPYRDRIISNSNSNSPTCRWRSCPLQVFPSPECKDSERMSSAIGQHMGVAVNMEGGGGGGS